MSQGNAKGGGGGGSNTYSPSTPNNWPVVPTTTTQALDEVATGLALANGPGVFAQTDPLYFDSINNVMWIGDDAVGLVSAFDATTSERLASVNLLPYMTNAFKIDGDTNYVYVTTSGLLNGNYVAIISKTTKTLIGLLAAIGGAQDMTADGSGAVWVADSGNNQVEKFLSTDIATAIANFPAPQSPSGGPFLVASGAYSIGYDSVDNQIWVSTLGQTPNVLYQLNTSGTTLNTYNLTGLTNFNEIYRFVYLNGFMWATTQSSSILQINPATFPAGGSVVEVDIAGSISTRFIYTDAFNTDVLVGDNNSTIRRISAIASPVLVESIVPGTNISSLSNGLSLPQAVINVVSTGGFPFSGNLNVATGAGIQSVSYSGITPTSFTGCTGGTGIMSTGGAITNIVMNSNISALASSSSKLWITANSNGVYIYNNSIGSELETAFLAPISEVWADGGSVVMNGGAPANIVANRPFGNSFTANKFQGIVNFGSDTTGTFTGATQNFAAILSGDQNTAEGAYSVVCGGLANTAAAFNSSVIGGTENQANGGNSIAGGNGCQANGLNSVAFGANCTTSSSGDLACGTSNTASGGNSVTLGAGNLASGSASISLGSGSNTTRTGEFGISSTGNGISQAGQLVYGGTGTNSTFVLTASGSQEFALTTQYYYAIQIRIVASATNAAVGPAMWVWDVLAHVAGGLAVLDGGTPTPTLTNDNGTGWLTTITVDGVGSLLHINFNTNTDTTNTVAVTADIKWAQVKAFNQ